MNDRKRKKILVITSSFPFSSGEHSGAFIFDLHAELEKLAYHSFILTPHKKGAAKTEIIDGMEIFRFPYFFPEQYQLLTQSGGMHASVTKNRFVIFQLPFYFASELIHAIRIIRREKPDIIHSHWVLPNGVVGYICSKFYSIPHIITIHGSDIHLAKRNRVFGILASFALRHATLITVNTNYTKSAVITVEPSVLKKIATVPMGIDLSRFLNIPQSKNRENPDGKFILFVGRLIEWKGTEYLIRSMRTVVDAFPFAKLIIVGTGPQQQYLENIVLQENLDKHIIFYNFVPESTLTAMYAQADVFVLPSITDRGYTEAQGVVLLEAMASGIPVIGSDTGGIPDIIQDGQNGFIVPQKSPDDISRVILRLLSDSELSKKISENGRKTIQNRFTLDHISNRFSECYQAL